MKFNPIYRNPETVGMGLPGKKKIFESFLISNSDKPGGFGEADLYMSRKKDGRWQKPVNMGNRINTAAYEYCSNMSPDGKFFFFSSEYQVKGVISDVLSKYLASNR